MSLDRASGSEIVRRQGDDGRGLTRVKRRRLELGLQQREVAAAAGISRAQLGRIEAGEQRPSLDTALRLAVALHTVPELL